ncbi:MAG: hypothetical protein KBC36_11695 [Spirochaetia bacterium]|nr:hypothetical protein [Spirochaetia bacterium]
MPISIAAVLIASVTLAISSVVFSTVLAARERARVKVGFVLPVLVGLDLPVSCLSRSRRPRL